MRLLLDALGLCEHCGILVNIEGMPADAMDAVWKCPECKKELTHKSFGFEQINGKWEKTQWVGKDGKLTATKPTEDFLLDVRTVFVNQPPFLSF